MDIESKQRHNIIQEARSDTEQQKTTRYDLKNTEAALRHSEATLNSIFRAAPTGIGLVRDRVLIKVNDRICEMLGYAREELEGQSARMLYPCDEEFEYVGREKYDRIRLMGTGTVETHWLRKDGKIIDTLLSSTPLDFDDLSQGVTFTALDITERKKAATALQEREKQFRELYDNAPNAYFSVNAADGRIRNCNNTACRLVGHDKETLLNTKIFDLYADTPQGIDRAKSTFQRFLAGETIRDVELQMQTANGRIFWASISVDAVKDQSGNIIESRSMVIDITDRIQAQEERQKLERKIQHSQKLESLGVLAGGIAHDFNNLLVSVLGNADLAALELAAESPAMPYIRDITTASIRLSELTKQMLAYSGKGSFLVEPLSLSRIVEELLHLLEVSISKKVALKLDLDPNVQSIEGDSSQVRQVIMNLITNASEAIGDNNGVISIRTGIVDVDENYLATHIMSDDLTRGHYVFLDIADTGCGMNEETIGKMFDPFYTTKSTGRGLGLAAVLGIMRSHKGAINVYSEQNRGSTIKLLFPFSCNAVARPDADDRNEEKRAQVEGYHFGG